MGLNGGGGFEDVEAYSDLVDAQLLLVELRPQRAGEPVEPAHAHCVQAHARRRGDDGVRGAGIVGHDGGEGLGGIEVGDEDAVEPRLQRLQRVRGDGGGGLGGVGDDEDVVGGPPGGEHGLAQLVGALGVGGEGVDLGVGGQLVLLGAGDDDAGAALRERLHQAAADERGASHDDHRL